MKRLLTLFTFLLTASVLFAGTIATKHDSFAPAQKHRGPLAAHVIAAAPSGLPRVGTRDPNTLDDVIISEDFEAIPAGQLPAGWTQVDVDHGSTTNQACPGLSEWKVIVDPGAPSRIAAHSGTHFVGNHYNDNQLANNDWLILPQQTLTDSIFLSYWIASQDPAWRENYEVRVSTTGAQPADFTHLIYTATNIDTAFISHRHDLTAYAGAPFYVAFHYNATDRFIIKLDDVLLEGTFTSPHGTIAGTITDDQSHAPLANAAVTVTGLGFTAFTDAAGHYLISSVPADTYAVTVRYDYYPLFTQNDVIVAGTDTTVLDVELHSPEFYTTDFASTGGNVHIADLDTARQTIMVSTENLSIADLDVTVNITHTWDADLTLWLTSPGGHRIRLAANVGGNAAENFVDCRFDDEATTPIGEGVAPFTGSFIPEEPLSVLDGEMAAGTWTLLAYDGAADDTGHIGTVTLHVKTLGSEAADAPRILPQSFVFDGNYPNPFNSQTEFRFSLPGTSPVQLTLYNLVGQEVARLVNGTLSAGTHTVAFNASGLTSGVYFARLSASGVTATHKMMLLK
ncbi:MAG TPA: choice-of-anchor J domain-containing protein [bacterium]|jgi:subtilisin-like proprotein convertase family protein